MSTWGRELGGSVVSEAVGWLVVGMGIVLV